MYLDAAADLPEIELRAIAARREGPLRAVAEARGGLELHTDWRDLVIRDDLDLVIVATSNASHHPIALAALRAGKHVLCEKPMANSAAEGRELYATARAAGVGHGVAHYMRFGEPIVALKGLIEAGELGEVRALAGRIWQPRAVLEPLQWFMRAEENPAGSLGVVGVHKIDLARYLTGGEVARVFAHLPTMLQERPDLGDISRLEAGRWMREQGTQLPANVTMAPVTASDFGTLHAELSTGALLSVSAAQSAFTRPGPTPDYQVHGTRASAFVFFDASNRRGGKLLLVRGFERDTEEVPLRVFKDARTHNAHIFTTYVLPGLQARAEGRPHATASFYDGWKAAEVIDAALASHASGAWVDLPEAQPAPA